jgi:CRP/FNR family transcriptional regulator
MLDMDQSARSEPHNQAPLPPAMAEGLAGGVACGRCPVSDVAICAAHVDAELGDISRRMRINAKTTLFEEYARANAVWSLVSGAVLLSKLLPDGRRQVLGIAVPGDFLGLSMETAYSFTATALTPVTICRFERFRFYDLLNRAPHLMRRVFITFSKELALAQDHMLLLGRRSAEEKVAAFLLGLRARWSPLHGLSARVDLPMTRQDIGDYLGLTLETVSRTMTKLAQRKIIAIIPDGVRILDVEKLGATASL